MKKIVCLMLACIFCGGALYAMELDGVKEHFLKSEWKDGIREGEALLSTAKRGSPNLDELYYYLALCYMKDRNYLRTSDIGEIILKEFPSSKFVPQAHYVLIDAYLSEGNVSAAQANAEAFLKKYPRSEHAAEVKERLKEFKGRAGTRYTVDTAPVVETAVGEPDLVLASGISQSAAKVAVSDPYWIQVGAFSKDRNADNLASKLRAASYTAAVFESVSKGASIFKVRVGPYHFREEALAVSKTLSRQGYPTKVIP